MKRIIFLLLLIVAQLVANAQTYVWKDGMPVVENPDSITFVQPDMGAQVLDVKEEYGSRKITYLYLTKDYEGKPLWQSAVLYLPSKQVTSKHVGKMALYNHYTIMSSAEAPSAGKEYKDKVRFNMNIAGDGPYDLSLTYHKFLEWQKLGMTAALPLTVITLNELFHIGLDYKDLFLYPLAANWKMWFLSKKFDLTEATELIAQDSIHQYIQPVYCDNTSAEVRSILTYADRLNVMNDWTPDPDTKLKMYHSLNDDVVPFENSRELYQFFLRNNCGNVEFDSTSLTSTHLGSASTFLMKIMSDFQNL